ncbi:MAG: AtpZ/AtpI family protein [Clostridiaceae bacterium]
MDDNKMKLNGIDGNESDELLMDTSEDVKDNLEKADSEEKKKENSGYGMVLGMCLGVALGVALDNLGLFMAVGLAVGVAFDAIKK